MTNITEEQFHAGLREQFAQHLKDVKAGKAEAYTFLAEEGVHYNSWLEHRHAWPIDENGQCRPSSAGDCADNDCLCDGGPVDVVDCDTCTKLLGLYEKAAKA